MPRPPKKCAVHINGPRGQLNITVEARTLYEAAGLALAEFRKQGIENRGIMQVTIERLVTYVVDPAKFWKWLLREGPRPSPWEQDVCDKLRDLLQVPLSREEKHRREER
jgi:hypothetical protein